MALITPNGLIVRAEDIRVGKSFIQFFCRTYSDLTLPAVDDSTIVAPYVMGENPYKTAYDYLVSVNPEWKSDEINGESIPFVIPELQEEKPKKTRKGSK